MLGQAAFVNLLNAAAIKVTGTFHLDTRSQDMD
jgi:hypothetical protein